MKGPLLFSRMGDNFYETCLLEKDFELPQEEQCQIFETYGKKQEVVCNGMKRIALQLNVTCKKGFWMAMR
jgi:hypothetical protein